MFEDWEKDEKTGNIKLAPVTSWSSAHGPMIGILRLQFVTGEDQLKTEAQGAVQLTMTAKQCRLLAQDLLKTAQTIEAQPLGTRQ